MPQDFKEAGRLAGESKALAAEAESASTKAKELRAQASGLEAREAEAMDSMAQLERNVQAAKQAFALAQWRRLKVSTHCKLPLLPNDSATSNLGDYHPPYMVACKLRIWTITEVATSELAQGVL